MKIRSFRDIRVQDTLYIDPREIVEFLGSVEDRMNAYHDRIQALEHRLADLERAQ